MAIQSLTTSSWMDPNRNLYLKFGTPKIAISTWGDYVAFGQNRVIEGVVDLSTITAGNTLIVSDVLFYPVLATGQLFIEKVEAVCETALTGGTSFSFGLIDSDRSTVPTNYNTAFINAEVTATFDTAGKAVTYVTGTSKAGGLIGSAPAVQTPIAPDLVNAYYLTVTTAGTYTAGKMRLRVYYHALDVAITQ